jgi:hypothetical protein
MATQANWAISNASRLQQMCDDSKPLTEMMLARMDRNTLDSPPKGKLQVTETGTRGRLQFSTARPGSE